MMFALFLTSLPVTCLRKGVLPSVSFVSPAVSSARRAWPLCLALLCALLGPALVGCGAAQSTLLVRVNARQQYAPEPVRGRYVLWPAEQGAAEVEDSAFLAIAEYVERALQDLGFTAAGCAYGQRDCPGADLAIIVDLERKRRRVPYLFQEPACASPLYSWDPYWYQPGWAGVYRNPGAMCRPIGYFEYEGSYAEYRTQLTLSALDLRRQRASSQGERRPWQLQMSAQGFLRDVDRVVPALLAAGVCYLGTDSGAERKVTVHEASPRVCRIAGRSDCPESP